MARPALHAHRNIVFWARLKGRSEGSFNDGEEENIRSSWVGLEHKKLGFGFEVTAIGPGPESGPPHLEPEYGGEVYVFEDSQGCHVARFGRRDVETEETTCGVCVVGAWCEGYVLWD